MSNILVVEDETHLAEGLRFNLEAEGYQVNVVETGEAALKQFEADKPRVDVVVLDVMLPGKSGFEVISELRQAGQFVPTLMLTARGHPEDVLKGFSAGADDYLTKPFDLSILIARIKGLLRRREWLVGQMGSAVAAPISAPPSDVFTFGEKTIDFSGLELRVRGQGHAVGPQAMRVDILPGQQTSAGGGTDGVLDVAALEQHALRRQPVNGRCADVAIAVAAQAVEALLVGAEEEDIRW